MYPQLYEDLCPKKELTGSVRATAKTMAPQVTILSHHHVSQYGSDSGIEKNKARLHTNSQGQPSSVSASDVGKPKTAPAMEFHGFWVPNVSQGAREHLRRWHRAHKREGSGLPSFMTASSGTQWLFQPEGREIRHATKFGYTLGIASKAWSRRANRVTVLCKTRPAQEHPQLTTKVGLGNNLNSCIPILPPGRKAS